MAIGLSEYEGNPYAICTRKSEWDYRCLECVKLHEKGDCDKVQVKRTPKDKELNSDSQ